MWFSKGPGNNQQQQGRTMETTTRTRIEAFFREASTVLPYLYSRWQDEREYEDIGDYCAPLDPIAQRHAVTIKKMTKRPFGCQIDADGIICQISVTLDALRCKRIA